MANVTNVTGMVTADALKKGCVQSLDTGRYIVRLHSAKGGPYLVDVSDKEDEDGDYTPFDWDYAVSYKQAVWLYSSWCEKYLTL